jgi:hypothetical protein
MLMKPGGVGERLGQQAPVPDGETELLGEEVGPAHDPGLSVLGSKRGPRG